MTRQSDSISFNTCCRCCPISCQSEIDVTDALQRVLASDLKRTSAIEEATTTHRITQRKMPKRQNYESDGGFVEDAPRDKKRKSEAGTAIKKDNANVNTTMQKDDEGNSFWEVWLEFSKFSRHY